MNKVNSFPVLIAPCSVIFLPSLSTTFEVAFQAKLLTNPAKTFLVKERARSFITF